MLDRPAARREDGGTSGDTALDTALWQRLKEILDRASELDGAARDAYLEEACAGDDALRAEAESLLVFDETESLIDRPAFDVNAADPRVGERIGPYRVRRLIDRGGMGAVYLATREDDFAKEVALKLIPRERLRPELVRRFHEERQILAELEHPSIARLLDGGTTDDGVPYLVMERIEGEPIDRYCDDRRLDVDARLELFRQACAAVQFSHQHLVLHCDVKPANVLVDGDGRPRLLDFGIARLLESERGPASTDESGPLSLRYASPEQVRGEPLTTASDVYSLGVLLYRLLAAHDPYGAAGLSRRELVGAILERAPELPSSAAGRVETVRGLDGERVETTPESVARARGTTPPALRRRLRGDLDAIVLRCLAKDRAERYRTVEQLVADLDRHRTGYPVAARDGGVVYRAGKTLRRRWRPLAVTALAALLLVVAGVATLRQREAERERLLVQREAERVRVQAEASANFVGELIWTASPDRADGELEGTEELLGRATARLQGDFTEPLLRSEFLAYAGRVFHGRGQLRQAESLLREALALQREHAPEDAEDLARRATALAVVLREKGPPERAEAETLFREALALLGGCSARVPDSLSVANNLAWLLTENGAYAEAKTLHDCVIEERRRTLEADDPDLAKALSSNAGRFFLLGDLAAAEELFREALAIARADALDEASIDVASYLNSLGLVLYFQGRLDTAEDALREALAMRMKLLGDDHHHVANTRKSLAAVLTERGAPAAAEPLARRAVATLRAELSGDHWRVADAESVLGAILLALGRRAEAEPLLTAAEARLRAARGGADPYAGAARRRLALLDPSLARTAPGGFGSDGGAEIEPP